MAISFYYPAYVGDGETLILPNPELFEGDSEDFKLVHNRVMSGDVNIVPIDICDVEVYRTLLFFNFIPVDKRFEILNFIKKAKNHYVKYTDYLKEEWICFIDNSKNIEIKISHRDDYCDLSFLIYRWKE